MPSPVLRYSLWLFRAKQNWLVYLLMAMATLMLTTALAYFATDFVAADTSIEAIFGPSLSNGTEIAG